MNIENGGEMNESQKKRLGSLLEEKIESYSGCMQFPIKGELWEEISVRALEAAGMLVEWDAGSHSSGADIWLSGLNEGISSKSGKITRTKTTGKHELSISSYRTTKYETLLEKLDFFDGPGKNFKNYLLLSREEDEKNKIRNYRCVLIDADKVTAGHLTWAQKFGRTGKMTGWAGENKKLGIRMLIQKAMSDQFWIYLDLNKFDGAEVLAEVSIPYEKLAKTHSMIRNTSA